MDDSGIVALLAERSERAITEASHKYFSYLKTIAYNILGNSEDAEQVANDTLMRLWTVDPEKIPPVIKTYLSRIAKNLAYDILRSERREKRGGGEAVLVLDELSECVSGNISAEEAFFEAEFYSDINAFLASLKAKHRKMFVLRYWYCFSTADIAERMGTSESTVSVTLSRLRGKLHDFLIERGYDL